MMFCDSHRGAFPEEPHAPASGKRAHVGGERIRLEKEKSYVYSYLEISINYVYTYVYTCARIKKKNHLANAPGPLQVLAPSRFGNLLLFFTLQGAAVLLEGVLSGETNGPVLKKTSAPPGWAPRAKTAASWAFLFLTHACLVWPPGWEKSMAMTRRYICMGGTGAYN